MAFIRTRRIITSRQGSSDSPPSVSYLYNRLGVCLLASCSATAHFKSRRLYGKRVSSDEYDDQRPRRSQRRSSLYDVLGISPKATQGEIKAAYYRLSKTFHPDRNKDSAEATQRFRDVADAYNVLGSHVARRRYDRGLLTVDIGGVVHGEEDPPDPINRADRAPSRDQHEYSAQGFAGNRYTSTASAKPTVGHRVGVYNFDTWTKFHYGQTLERNAEARKTNANKKERREKLRKRMRSLDIWAVLLIVAVISFWTIEIKANNHDMPSISTVSRHGSGRRVDEEITKEETALS